MAILNYGTSLYGRQVIYSSVGEINKSNILKVLKDAITIHTMNETRITYLENYYKGDQPILSRTKIVRADINNKIVENRAFEIVEFMTNQNFGEPVQYVRTGTNESKSDDVQKLNKAMAMCDKQHWDVEIGKWKSICGTAYRTCFIKDNDNLIDGKSIKINIGVARPQDAFVVYSSSIGNEPLLGVYRTANDNNQYTYTCYTKNKCFVIKEEKLESETVNGFGKIPIIEYPNNSRRLGDFELVLPMLDAINKIQSNRLDGIEQFIQAFMLFKNCQISETEFLAMKELGAIEVHGDTGMQADVSMVSEQLDQTQTQVTKEDIWESVLSILGLPNRQENSGGDTGAAVVMRNGWQFAEQRAELSAMMFEKSEREFLRVVLKILTVNEVLSLEIGDIEIKITRSKADNLMVKTQALQILLQCGVDFQVAIKTCGLWSDSEDVFIKSSPLMELKFGKTSLVKPVIKTTPTVPPQTA